MKVNLNLYLPDQYLNRMPDSELRRYISELTETTGYVMDQAIILVCDIPSPDGLKRENYTCDYLYNGLPATEGTVDDIEDTRNWEWTNHDQYALKTIAAIFSEMEFKREPIVSQEERVQHRDRSVRDKPIKILAVRGGNTKSKIYSEYYKLPKGFIQCGQIPHYNWMLLMDKESVDFMKRDIRSRYYADSDIQVEEAMEDFITDYEMKEEWYEGMLHMLEEKPGMDDLGKPLMVLEQLSCLDGIGKPLIPELDDTSSDELQKINDTLDKLNTGYRSGPTILNMYFDQCDDADVIKATSQFALALKNAINAVGVIRVHENPDQKINTLVSTTLEQHFQKAPSINNIYINGGPPSNDSDSRAETSLFD